MREYLQHPIHSEIKRKMTSIQTTPKHPRIAPNLPKCNKNSMIEGGGRVWRLDLAIWTDLKISGNVIRDGKTGPTGGGLKFPSTTKSLD